MQEVRFTLSWQLLEKVGLSAMGLFLLAVLTVARPWLAKWMAKLQRENKAEFRELTRELNEDAFIQLEQACTDAKEALRLVTQMRERVERLESASSEQGQALAHLSSVPGVMDRVEEALRSCLSGLGDLRESFGRLDERTTKR